MLISSNYPPQFVLPFVLVALVICVVAFVVNHRRKKAQQEQELQAIRELETRWNTWLRELELVDLYPSLLGILQRQSGADGGREIMILRWLLTTMVDLASSPKTDAGRSLKFAGKAVRHAARNDLWADLVYASPEQFALLEPTLKANFYELAGRGGGSHEFAKLAARLITGKMPPDRACRVLPRLPRQPAVSRFPVRTAVAGTGE